MNYPLTQQGVADLQATLYSLSDSAREAEATAIRADFRTWVADHFELTAAQKTYLSQQMPDRLVTYLGDECWLCFIFKLPITFIYPAPPSPSGYGKLVEAESSTKTRMTGGDGSPVASGSLTVKISYQAF